jgi:hypothetical protein
MTNNSRHVAQISNSYTNAAFALGRVASALEQAERDINARPDCCQTVDECRWYNASVGAIIRAEREVNAVVAERGL